MSWRKRVAYYKSCILAHRLDKCEGKNEIVRARGVRYKRERTEPALNCSEEGKGKILV